VDTPRRSVSRLRAFFFKPPLDADLETRIQAHIGLACEENLGSSLSPLKPVARRWCASAVSTRPNTNNAKREDL
jgi:hypothetical protein